MTRKKEFDQLIELGNVAVEHRKFWDKVLEDTTHLDHTKIEDFRDTVKKANQPLNIITRDLHAAAKSLCEKTMQKAWEECRLTEIGDFMEAIELPPKKEEKEIEEDRFKSLELS